MSNDRELLELAAKAAGIEVWFPRLNGGKNPDGTRIILTPCYTEIDRATVEWNPLKDDGDALRLAVMLDMHIIVDGENNHVRVYAQSFAKPEEGYGDCGFGKDKSAATRRAIVRAAAEIGKATGTQA